MYDNIKTTQNQSTSSTKTTKISVETTNESQPKLSDISAEIFDEIEQIWSYKPVSDLKELF